MPVRSLTRPLAVLIFALLCLAPLAATTGNWLWPWPFDTNLANEPPKFPRRIDSGLPHALETWFTDRARRHLPLLAINTAYQVGVLYRSINPRIVFGSDGWIFYTDEIDKPGTMANFRGRLRFSEEEVRRIDRNLTAMRETLSGCGIRSLFVVAPNKQSIYGEYLAGRAPAKAQLDDLLERLTPQARAAVLDLREPLRAAKVREREGLLYYKTNSHWNRLGAFYGYQAIVAALPPPVANAPLAARDAFTLHLAPHTGDLVNLLTARHWIFDTAIELKRKNEVAPPGNAGSLLLLGDSFSENLEGYFEPHFSDVRYVRLGALETAFADGAAKPSVIVFELAERYMPPFAGAALTWQRFCTMRPH